VLIIGILAAASVPALKKNTINARSSAVMNDLRVYSGAFQAYAQEHGDWPPGGSSPGVFPAGMDGYLSATNWSRKTPIGGNYQFATQSPQGAAATPRSSSSRRPRTIPSPRTSTSSPTSTRSWTTAT
jgi:type II secretory pathway pseudopilin PulG